MQKLTWDGQWYRPPKHNCGENKQSIALALAYRGENKSVFRTKADAIKALGAKLEAILAEATTTLNDFKRGVAKAKKNLADYQAGKMLIEE